MLEALLYFVAGYVTCNFLAAFREAKSRVEQENEVSAERKKVLIEYHSDCFFAYDDSTSWFLAQDISLADLVLKVMKNDPSVIVAASDEFVISELKKLVASSQQ